MSKNHFYSKQILWTIVIVAIVRIIYVLMFPFDLAGDEAYYWDWGRRLSWGYFSKPPFIAWLMAFAGWLGGNTDTGIRLMAVALGTGSICMIYALAQQLWGVKGAFWAVALTLAAPGNVVVNLILTIDAPLMFFWSGALLFFYNQVHNERYTTLWTVLTVLFVGFGFLSKQMMFAFYPLAITYLFCQPETRIHLKHSKIWISWAISTAFLIPTLIWNAQNDWITVSHTQHHFEGKSVSALDILSRSGEFLGTQMAAMSFVTYVALMIILVMGVIGFRKLSSKAKYLLVFSAPGLLMVTVMLLRQSINANWPAVFYTSLIILLGGTVAEAKEIPDRWKQMLKGWRYPALITGTIMALLIMLVPFVLEWTGQTGAKNLDPVVRLEGWSELGEKVQRAKEIHGSELNNPFFLTTGHRYTTSHLAFYLVGQPRVFHWPKNPGVIESQYELWGFDDDLRGRDAIIVVPGKDTLYPESVEEVFDSIEHLEAIEVTRSKKRTRYYTLYIGKALKLSSTP